MKNKRGDVPVIILVVGVVAICGFAILSFIISEKVTVPDKLDLDVFEKTASQVEKFNFYVNAGQTLEEAAEKIDATFDGTFVNMPKVKSDDGKIEISEFRFRYP